MQIISSEQVFHQKGQLSAPDGKHEGKEIQHSKQTRRSISLQTFFFSQVDHPCKLSQSKLLFSFQPKGCLLITSQQYVFGYYWVEIYANAVQ